MAQANESTAKVCDFAMHETTRIGPIHHVLSANLLTKQISYPFPGNPDEGSRKRAITCVRVSFVCVSRVCEDMPAAFLRFRSLPDDEWLWVFVLLLLALVVNKREK